MKVYVRGYRPLTDEELDHAPLGARDNTAVVYSAEPDWQFEGQSEAVSECTILEAMGTHVGNHFCNFAVERLQSGRFTIVCLTHPDDLALAAPIAVERHQEEH